MTQCKTSKSEFQEIKGRKVEGSFDGGTISSDGGAILLRELCLEKEYIKKLSTCFVDHREPDLVEHSLESLLAQRIFGLCLGYEDLNDHEELRKDPLLSVLCGQNDILGQRRRQKVAHGIPLAGKSTLNRLELTPSDASKESRYKKIVYSEEAIEGYFVDCFLDSFKSPPKTLVFDLDATDIPLFGKQEGRYYHGYYDSYCYLPLYIFCGSWPLSAQLRTSDIDGSFGAVEEVERIVAQVRERFPDVSITLRADSGFARDDLMTWCEENDVHFLFGLAQNQRLNTEITQELAEAKQAYETTLQPARVYKDFRYSTLGSWSSERRVVGKAEHLEKGSNPRFIVTSLEKEHVVAKELYETHYCIRGDMENRIKEQQLCLFADRTSGGTMRVNQLRIWFSTVAYMIMNDFRESHLKGTKLEHVQCNTLRNRLLKIGTRIVISARRIYLSFASSFPYKELFQQILAKMQQPSVVSA